MAWKVFSRAIPEGAPDPLRRQSLLAAITTDVVLHSYSIGDLAKEFEVTARTIRFYEDRGLLAPERKGQNRVYTQRDHTRLKLILRGKRLGFSITEISEILDLYDAPDGERSQLQFFVAKIRARRTELEAQARDLEAVMTELDDVEQRCNDLIAQHKSSS